MIKSTYSIIRDYKFYILFYTVFPCVKRIYIPDLCALLEEDNLVLLQGHWEIFFGSRTVSPSSISIFRGGGGPPADCGAISYIR